MSDSPFAFIVIYTHRHGTDFSVYEDEPTALRWAVFNLLPYLSEISKVEERNELRQLARDGAFKEFCNRWGEYHPRGETIEISHISTLDPVDTPLPKLDIGEDEILEETYECSNCGGSGGGPDLALYCSICNGKGVIGNRAGRHDDE